MKKLFVLSLSVLVMLSSACEREQINDDFVSMDDILTVSKSIEAQAMTKGGDAEPVTLNFTASYSISEDTILSFGLSSNSDVVDDARLNEALKSLLEEELGENYTDLEALETSITKAAQAQGTAMCLRECKQKYEKGNGRGDCRFDCWTELALKVLPIIISGLGLVL